MSGLEFGWGEVNDLTLMAIKLSGTGKYGIGGGTSIVQTYQGQKAMLMLSEDNLLLQPVERYASLTPQLPEWMNSWCKTQIMLGEGGVQPMAETKSTLVNYQKWWKDIEHHLFNGIRPKASKIRRTMRFLPE